MSQNVGVTNRPARCIYRTVMAMRCCIAGCIDLAHVLRKLNLGFTHGIDHSVSQCGFGTASPAPEIQGDGELGAS